MRSTTMPKRLLLPLLLAIALLAAMPLARAHASSGDLDEILDYTITVDVNEDATLDMLYHIDWKVLDSTSDGPLSWVRIGIPNMHYVSIEPLSDTIAEIRYSSNGGNYVRIDLDRSYYADEVVSFDFKLVQDYMYQVNRDRDGETVYEFTPGWFNDLEVDHLRIRWNDEKVVSFMPSALQDGGYYVWDTSLDNGEHYSVTLAYKNDAYAFDIDKTIENEETYYNDSYYQSSSYEDDGWPFGLIGLCISGFWILIAFFWVKNLIQSVTNLFRKDSGFTAGKKITRTKVVYYPSCPSCGAPREEGKDSCEYCGRSLIQSEEIISEKDIPPEEKAIKAKKSDGEYAFSTLPNTYLRVHVVPVPVSSHRSSSSSSRGSSCAHSSCACACACGCACACACAGGGRAGCTVKDFYNTDLKLSQLENA